MNVLLLLCFQIVSPLPSSTGFADALMKQGDYFRAITEYKRTLYLATDDSIKSYCLLQIATAYRKSAKYESAVEYAAELLMNPGSTPAHCYRANLAIGLSYLESSMPQLALTYFDAARGYQDSLQFPLLCLGLTHVELRNYQKSVHYFEEAAQRPNNPQSRSRSLEFAARVRHWMERGQKSPTLAGVLSTIIPGAGQLYSDHTYDALQAFFYTASMAYGTYAMYRYEQQVKGQLLWTYVGVSITGIFHAANVIGAYRTAEYRNWKLKSDFSRELYNEILKFEAL